MSICIYATTNNSYRVHPIMCCKSVQVCVFVSLTDSVCQCGLHDHWHTDVSLDQSSKTLTSRRVSRPVMNGTTKGLVLAYWLLNALSPYLRVNYTEVDRYALFSASAVMSRCRMTWWLTCVQRRRPLAHHICDNGIGARKGSA